MLLKKLTIKGLSWTASAQFLNQIFQLGTYAILANLLDPKDFGLIGMSMVFIGFLQIFNDFGIGKALIQKQDIDDELIHSCFWANILVGSLLALVIIVSSPIVAWFYNEAKIVSILIIMGFNFPVVGASIVQRSLFEKKLDFKKTSIIDIISNALGAIAAIIIAFYGGGVWALVFNMIIKNLVATSLLIIKMPDVIGLSFNYLKLKTILAFSFDLLGFNIVNYFSRNVDNLLIGKFLGATPLGYYTLAYNLMLYPLSNITGILSRVLYPAMAKVQNDGKSIRHIYSRSIGVIALITFPMMIGLFVIAPDLIDLIFGAKWKPAVEVIKILAIVGLVQSILSFNGNIYLIFNKTSLRLKLGFLFSLISTCGIVLGLLIGKSITYVALGYAISAIFTVPIAMYVPLKLMKLNLRDLIKSLYWQFLAAIPILSLLFSNPSENLIELFAKIAIGCTIYSTCVLIAFKSNIREIYNEIFH